MTLSRPLTGPLARSLAVLLVGPRAAGPETEFLSPELSDLLTYLLLQPRI